MAEDPLSPTPEPALPEDTAAGKPRISRGQQHRRQKVQNQKERIHEIGSKNGPAGQLDIGGGGKQQGQHTHAAAQPGQRQRQPDSVGRAVLQL